MSNITKRLEALRAAITPQPAQPVDSEYHKRAMTTLAAALAEILGEPVDVADLPRLDLVKP